MKNVRVRLQAPPIYCLQFAQLFRLRFVRVDRECFVNKEVPNFLAALPCIKRFILRVAYSTELLVRHRGLCAVGLTDEMNHAFTLIYSLSQKGAQISAFSPDNV